MAVEVIRKLINGAWRTVAEDAGGNGGGSSALKASLTLTHTDLLALNATPVTIVAAQGSGTIIVPVLAVWTTRIAVGYDTTATRVVFSLDADNQFTQLTTGAPPAIFFEGRYISVDPCPLLGIINGPNVIGANESDDIVRQGYENTALSVTTLSGSFTGGDPANSLKVDLLYMLSEPA